LALLKKRPRLALEAEPELIPGGTARGTVIVDASEAVPIEWLRIGLVGEEFGGVGSGKSRSTRKVELCEISLQLAGEGELAAGERRYEFALAVPGGLPPSYEGDDAYSRYRYEVRLSIPWWPDARSKHDVLMLPASPHAEHPGRPIVLSSDPGGPKAGAPHVELSLASSVLAGGDLLRGAVALSNVEHNRYHRVLLELWSIEDVRLGRWTRGTTKKRKHRYAIDVAGAGEGEQQDFTIALPERIASTYRSQLWELRWQLRIRVDIRWALDLKLDIDAPVVCHRFRDAGARRLPPAVGTPRLEAAWLEVAEATGLELAGSSLRAVFGDVVLHIYREHRGSDGIFVVGTLAYPYLHLDLEVGPGEGLFGRSARRGIQLGIAAWDKQHQVRCRDEEQARRFFAPLLEALRRLEPVTMNDESLVTEIANNGTDPRELERFAAPLMELAQVIPRARKGLPPPASVSQHLEIWRELAERVDGEVDPGSMRIEGRFGGRELAIETTWTPDGEPAEITVGLRLRGENDPAMCCTVVPELLMELPAALPAAARPLIESLAGVARRLRIDGSSVRTSTAWLADPRHSLGLVRTLAELADTLRPPIGPYR
jgi:hypothetical protein